MTTILRQNNISTYPDSIECQTGQSTIILNHDVLHGGFNFLINSIGVSSHRNADELGQVNFTVIIFQNAPNDTGPHRYPAYLQYGQLFYPDVKNILVNAGGYIRILANPPSSTVYCHAWIDGHDVI